MVEEKVQTFFPLSNYKTSCLKECQKHDGQVKILEVTGEDPTCTFVTLPLQSFAFQAQGAIGCPPLCIKDSTTVQYKLK